jgi:copper chaperone CopZ
MSTQTTTLKVTGQQTMHCGGCESTVKFALQQLTGVQQVDASHKTQLISLTFDSETLDMGRIRQELDWIGYQVAEVTET